LNCRGETDFKLRADAALLVLRSPTTGGDAQAHDKNGHFFCVNLCNFRLVRKILKSDYWFRRVCMYVRQHGTTQLPRDGF